MTAEKREWCDMTHNCHHWFESECSGECDRGEHDAPWGHVGCSDRQPVSPVEKKE